MENPYKSPTLDASDDDVKRPVASRFRAYQVVACCVYLLTVCASVAGRADVFSLDYLFLIVHLLGLMLCLFVLGPGLAVRAIYLMIHHRRAEGTVDLVLSGFAAATLFAAVAVNPISG
jgi:hypothetical protein